MADQIKDNLISCSDAHALILAHDGDCALLYLWIALTGSRDYEQAARDLCMTRSQIDTAAEKLARMLTLPAQATGYTGPSTQEIPAKNVKATLFGKQQVIRPSDEFPEYTAAEIDSISRSDSGFHAVLSECEQLFGKQLSRHEMSRLLGIYNHLGLPAEVIYILLHYCADISRGPAGAERKPTMRFIEQQAYNWVNRDIITMETAEEYVESQKAILESENRIQHLLEIYDRRLITTEKNFISSWITMGFTDDAVRLAYERCINNIGKRSFSYINSILKRWHEAGIHSASEAEARDPGKNLADNNSGKSKHTFIPTEF